MAKRPTDRQRKQELIAALAESRQTLGRSGLELKQRLNPARRLRTAVRNNPLPAFGVAAGFAFLVTLVLRRPRRKRVTEKPAGTKRLLLRWVLSLAKPAARAWLLHRAKDHFLPTPARHAGSPPGAGRPARSRP